MLLSIFTIRDAITECYSNPFYAHNKQAAVRLFDTLVNDPSTEVNKSPSDYALFELGVWDDNAGSISMLPQPLRVISGVEVKRADEEVAAADLAKLNASFKQLSNAVSQAMLSMQRPVSNDVVPAKKGWFR